MTKELLDYCNEFWSRPKMEFRTLLKSPFKDTFINWSNQLNSKNSSQIIWHILNNTFDIPKCRCGNNTKYNNSRKNYSAYCSKDCGYKDPQRQQRIQTTMVARYGVSNAAHSTEFSEKKKATNLVRLGVDHPSKSEKIKDKKKQTMIDNWGVKNPSQHPDIQKLKINTNQKRYGVDWPGQSQDVLEKQKATNLERYGVEWTMQSSEVKDKAIQTMLFRYGVEAPLQNATIKSNTILTNMERYGFPIPSMNVEVRKKGIQTMLDRYGVTSNNHINYSQEVKEALLDPEKFANLISNMYADDASKKLGISINVIYRYAEKYDIPILQRIKQTSYELVIRKILEKNNLDFEFRNRSILNGKELDFYLPNHDLAIEVGAVYWHSELSGNRPKSYHQNKWQDCKNLNISLLQYFDNDIINYPHLIESKIKRSCNISVPIIGARKCKIVNIYPQQEREFLERFHLQGYNQKHTWSLGATYDDRLIAVLTINQKKDQAEIVRWVTDVSHSYPGLFTRMLTQFTNNFSGIIITYSDNRYGTGNVYSSSGFKFSHVTTPGYFYFKNNGIGDNLESRIKYQKHKLTKRFSLEQEYVNSKTEWEIMQEQGYDRFWDAGHTLWKLKV